jgi:hypothetical protein
MLVIILSTLIFIGITIFCLIGENGKKYEVFMEGTFLGDVGFFWVNQVKGTDGQTMTKTERFVCTMVSLTVYCICTIIISLILGVILRWLWFIIIPLMLISEITIKIKKKK